MRRPALSPRPPLSSRLCEGFCIAFALWTVCCHWVIKTDGTLTTLLGLFVPVAVVVVLVLSSRRVRGLLEGRGSAPAFEAEAAGDGYRPPKVYGVVLLVGPAVAFGLYKAGRGDLLWWWVAVILTWGVLASAFDSPRLLRPARGSRLEVGLWILAFFCVLLSLAAHRYDPDDAAYVNFAVAAADRAHDWPLMSTDTLHDFEHLPLHLPAYKLHSYELLNGALSYLTGIPAIYCFHWISAALAALFVPLAWATLFRRLTPRTWLVSTACLLLVFVAVGGMHRWYGNFAFVRLWQGKSIYLSVFLPLIYAYGLRFSRRPTAWNFGLLAAAQIASLGCSSSAVWSAPVAAVLAVVSGLPPRVLPSRRDVGLVIAAVASASYVVGLGLFLKRTIQTAVGPAPKLLDLPLGVPLGSALGEVLGSSGVLAFALLALVGTWTLYPPGVARRFVTLVPWVVWILFLNPYLAGGLIGQVVGPSYWRLLWALPLPLLMTLLLTAPLGFAGRRARLGAVVAVLALLFVLFVPADHGLGEGNRTVLKAPGLKVWHPTYDWAETLVQNVPPGSRVLVPNDIGQWIPTFHHHPYPLSVYNYLFVNRHFLAPDDFQMRYAMTSYVEGAESFPGADELFRRGLRRYRVEGVILYFHPGPSERTERARAVLQASGYSLHVADYKRELWLSPRLVVRPTVDAGEMAYLRQRARDPSLVFRDGFEGGDFGAWASAGTPVP